MPHDREVVGSNPARCWACSSLPNQWCVLNQVPHQGATLLIFLKKIFMLSCAAWGRASLISTDWAKKKHTTSWTRKKVSLVSQLFFDFCVWHFLSFRDQSQHDTTTTTTMTTTRTVMTTTTTTTSVSSCRIGLGFQWIPSLMFSFDKRGKEKFVESNWRCVWRHTGSCFWRHASTFCSWFSDTSASMTSRLGWRHVSDDLRKSWCRKIFLSCFWSFLTDFIL